MLPRAIRIYIMLTNAHRTAARFFYIMVLIAVFAVSMAFAGPADEVSVTTLPNGVKVIVREGHAVNLVAVDIWIRAGSMNETDATSGVSHFVEHMIFKATDKYGPGEMDREIEGIGAELNGGTSRDWAHYYTTVASEYLPTALDVLADAVTNARFEPDEIEKERRIILDEIARSDGNSPQRALNLFSQAAFAVHPYRLPPTGMRESVARVTRDDLVTYYNRYYVPANTCVVIAGDVSKSDAVALVEKAFAGFTRAGRADSVAVPTEPPITAPRVKRFETEKDQTYLVLGYLAPPASQFREACALDVMLAILGDTYQGRISAALNAKGIHFGTISTDFISQRYPTTFSTLASVAPKDADAVVSVLLAEYGRLGSEPVSDGELQLAKRLVEGGDLFDQETFAGQARALGLYESIASYDLALKYAPMVRSLRADDIMEVAAKYFGANNYCLARMEPASTAK